MFIVQDDVYDVRHEFHDFAPALAFLKTSGDCAKVYRAGCVETITVHYWGRTIIIEDCTDYSELWLTEEIVQEMYDCLAPDYFYVTGTFLARFPRIPSSVRCLLVDLPEPSFRITVSHTLDVLEIWATSSLTACKIQTLCQFARCVKVDNDYYEECVIDVFDDTDVAKCLVSY